MAVEHSNHLNPGHAPAFEEIARALVENDSRNLFGVDGQYVGKVGRYQGKWHVAGPLVLREFKLELVLAMGVEEFNKGERQTTKHFYVCDTVADATSTYEALLLASE